MSLGDVARQEGAKGKGDAEGKGDAQGDTKLACCKAMSLGTRVLKVTQSLHVARKCA
ncbi:unnamed protein product [Prunus armeniaca]